MTLPGTPMESLAERDVDLLLLEEFHSSPAFLCWWLERVGLTPGSLYELVGAWHSVSHASLGESDLILLTRDAGGDRTAILIENKIDAPPQPTQGERYRMRGHAGVEEHDWDRFVTCIVAPAQYLAAQDGSAAYDASIPYEEIGSWVQSNLPDTRRGAYKASLLSQAVEQQRRGYTPKAHPHVTAFWKGYWLLAAREFPELSMPEPGPKPAESYWIEFRPTSLGPDRHLYHKLTKGFVDLQLDGAARLIDTLAQENQSVMADDIKLVTTGKSASFRITVPSINHHGDVDAQADHIRAGLRSALKLLALSRAIHGA